MTNVFRQKWPGIASETAYSDLLRGKTIALVGGHDDINWNEVNKCDLVARVNGHWVRQRGRINLLYYSCAADVSYSQFDCTDFWRDLQFAHLNITHTFFANEQNSFHDASLLLSQEKVPWDMYVVTPRQAYQLIIGLRDLPERYEWSQEFTEEFDIYPFTGVLALRHLTLQPVKSIYVDGMNLFVNRAENNRYGSHYLPSNVHYLRSLCFDTKRPPVTFSTLLWKTITNFKWGSD